MNKAKVYEKISEISWKLLQYEPSKLEENGLSPINLVGAHLAAREEIEKINLAQQENQN